jgi:hypothetical protein
MNCNPIVERYHPQVAALKLRDCDPKAPAVVLLPLNPQRPLDGSDAPLFAQVRALAKYFVLEVRSELVRGHASKIERA